MDGLNTETWVSVNAKDIAMSSRLWTNPFTRVAADLRRSMMFSNGMSMHHILDGREYSMNPQESTSVSLAWERFAHEVDIHFILYGFAIFVMNKKRGHPIIIDPNSVNIFVNVEDGVSRYIVKRLRTDVGPSARSQDLPGARVVEKSAPTQRGRLTCVAKSMYHYLVAHDLSLELAPVAWLAEARPTCYVRSLAPDPQQIGELLDAVFAGDANNNVIARDRAMREANIVAMAEREQQRASSFIEGIQNVAHGVASETSTLRDINFRSDLIQPNIFPLPTNSTIDQVVRPAFHQTLEEVGNFFAMLVARLMSVPAFDTGQSGARYTAAVALTTSNAAIYAAASDLQCFLSKLASEVLEMDMVAHVLSVADLRGTASSDVVPDIGRVRVTIHCAVSIDMAQSLYDRGMMTHNQFASVAALATHIPRAMFAPYHVDPLTGRRVVVEDESEDGGGDTKSKSSASTEKRKKPGPPTKRRKTDIEHAETNLKTIDSSYTGMK